MKLMGNEGPAPIIPSLRDQLLKDVISELRAIRALLERGTAPPPEQAPRASAWTAGMVPVPTCRAEIFSLTASEATEQASAAASAVSSAEAVELQGLRAEVRACVSSLWSIEKVLTRFDQDGLPPARAMG